MSKPLYEVVAEATNAIREAAKADALSDAVELVTNDETLIKQVVDESISLWLNGVPFYTDGVSPLSVTADDRHGSGTYSTHDPIAYAIEVMDDYREFHQEECQRYFTRCIESLQSGIDRLRAYEAERLKAQS